MKTLNQLAQENPAYYAQMAQAANQTGKMLAVDENQQLVLRDIPVSADEVRLKRNYLLEKSDKYIAIPDFQVSAEHKAEFLIYRQKLRDIPLQHGFPENVIWPDEP